MAKRKEHSNVKTECPVCHDNLSFEVVQIGDSVPYFGDVLETFGKCTKCGFTSGDILFFEDEKIADVHQELIVDSVKKLSYRVVKSKKCTIKIPEIDLVVEPGSHSDGFVSNVEGVLEKLIDNIKRFHNIYPEKSGEVGKIVSELEKMKAGKNKFTLVLEDPSGRSFVGEDKKKHN